MRRWTLQISNCFINLSFILQELFDESQPEEEFQEEEHTAEEEMMDFDEFHERDLDWASCEELSDHDEEMDDDVAKNTIR